MIPGKASGCERSLVEMDSRATVMISLKGIRLVGLALYLPAPVELAAARCAGGAVGRGGG